MTNNTPVVQKWILPKPVKLTETVRINLPIPLLNVLLRRGFINTESVNRFLSDTQLPDPEEHFPELKKAVERLIKAANCNEKIAICGDYDADGMTSSSLIKHVLSSIKANHEVLIPNRLEDGYGLNENMIRELYSRNVGLIITVDNGVSAIDAIKLANSLNIDLIITDHHQIPNDFINVYALVHPEQTPEDSPYRYLAGVGLAYILSVKLLDELSLSNKSDICLDLFCIGTIADMSCLKGANRHLLKKGLSKLYKTKCKGLLALLRSSGITYRDITSEDIAFKIAPRINSVGRISNPNIILDLFSESNDQKINNLALRIENVNNDRKRICSNIMDEALEIVDKDTQSDSLFFMVTGNNWHPGVIGIVASRILDKYNKPVAVMTSVSNTMYRASARAPYSFNLIAALDSSKHLLESYGGHKAAAGFTVSKVNINNLRFNLNNLCKTYPKDTFIPIIAPDSSINFSDINNILYSKIINLGPFGIGNDKPLFTTRNVIVRKIINLGSNHIKLILEHNNTILTGIHWNTNYNYLLNEQLEIAFYIEVDRFEKIDIQLNIIGVRKFYPVATILYGDRYYRCSLNNKGYIVIENENGLKLCSENINNILNNISLNDKKYIDTLFGYSQIALGISN